MATARERRAAAQGIAARGMAARGTVQAGFTLIELMVVVVIIGILATVGAGYFQTQILQANLNQAVPYLQSIAAKNRLHMNRTGRYLATSHEDEILRKLGVDVKATGDFCFMIFCTDATRCGNHGASPFTGSLSSATLGTFVGTTNDTDPVPLFQVIAVLHQSTDTTESFAGSTCTAATGTDPKKLDGASWVADGGKGGRGRAVILSYPPPPDGYGGTRSRDGNTVTLSWDKGITLTDALLD